MFNNEIHEPHEKEKIIFSIKHKRCSVFFVNLVCFVVGKMFCSFFFVALLSGYILVTG